MRIVEKKNFDWSRHSGRVEARLSPVLVFRKLSKFAVTGGLKSRSGNVAGILSIMVSYTVRQDRSSF